MDDLTSDSPTVGSALSGVGGMVAGRYQVRARLGRGATKDVYLAYDERLDRDVALAVVFGAGAGSSDAARARVAREAQVTGRLGDHPNVITVYDSGEHEGVPYLVLRVMSGGSLADRLERERPSIEDAMRIGGEIARALAHAHAHGVVHRDVKPDNVWLSADGSAALGDFGIAFQAGQERLTAEGLVVGTVRYLSPEQIRGGDVGAASDLYALGITLYELVAGSAPFTGDDPRGVLMQHLTAMPEPPSRHEPAVPSALERLILELLAKRPEERPPSAGAVVAALAEMRAPPPAPATARRPDARRLVSVLVARADVDDPEALHGVFDRCAEVLERHGGSVEHYLGDALVAMFGLDESHGDDALRAARAAVELRAETAELRLGLEMGEVFVARGPRGEPVATGSPISDAGRLAERATQGEILLGERILRLVAADASIDDTGSLLTLQADQPALLRTPQTAFVGRERELAVLHEAFAAARRDRACRLVTVAGPPGIGKSRLAGEFLAAIRDRATVLAGRCLAYGEGTTYRAIADIVRGLGGDDPRRRIEELLAGDDQAIRGILSAIGLSGEPAQADETAWALRRLVARLASERPLVVAVEDVHWAEPALLDMLDHVVALTSDAPVLLVCLTRPELLQERPEWGATQPDRAVLILEALDDEQARELAERLGAKDLAPRIAQRAEGNPLFVEQLVAVDAGDRDGELPTSIQAVLSARIDRLDAAERALLQRASVEGRTFHAGALAAGLPQRERDGLATGLAELARKELVESDQAEFAGEEAYRFTHALIRDAAYAGVPKALRAELHVGTGEWLAQRSAPDEILGYHFEQACLLRAELGRSGERERLLAARAVSHLRAASTAALARVDPAAASALLERAIALSEPADAPRGALLSALGSSLYEAGRMTEATRVLDEAVERAEDALMQARALVEREFVRLESATSVVAEDGRRVADAAMPVFERDGDEYGKCRVWSLRAQLAWTVGHIGVADDAWAAAADCARQAGAERELFDVLGWRATAAMLGPTPVDAAIRRCEGLRQLVGASPVAVIWMVNPLASLYAMKGEFESAERFLRDANAVRHELGHVEANLSHHEAFVRLLAGQPGLAEALLRAGAEQLAQLSDGRMLATTNAMLAQALYAQGEFDEAGELCRRAADGAASDDTVTQVMWRGVQAKILAAGGRCAEAETLAREGVALVEPTDMLSYRGDAMLDLSEVLVSGSRAAEAERALHTAIALYDMKGNAVAAARARALLDEPQG